MWLFIALLCITVCAAGDPSWAVYEHYRSGTVDAHELSVLMSPAITLHAMLSAPVVGNCTWPLKTQRKKAHYRSSQLSYSDLYDAHTKNLRAMSWIGGQLRADVMINWGTLLGQYFNAETLPWDEDIDVCLFVQEAQVRDWMRSELPRSNYSRHEHNDRHIEYFHLGSEHVFYYDYNPHHHIEFRLIHVATGVYVDIVLLKKKKASAIDAKTVRGSKPKLPWSAELMYTMKANEKRLWGGHVFNLHDIQPLQPCLVNGVPLKCPANKLAILTQAYGPKAQWTFKGEFDGSCFVLNPSLQ